MHNKIYYINGEFLSNQEAKISFYDASFLYGDGIFETFRFQNNKLFYPNKHLARLRDGLKSIELKYNKHDNEIIKLLESLISLNSIDSGLLRLMITRGDIEGPIWEYDGSPNTYIAINPLVNSLRWSNNNKRAFEI